MELTKGVANTASTLNWESRGLIVEVHKRLDSTKSPVKIDLAATLGAASDLPLVVKKAVRYWFDPTIKTKDEVVRYVNEVCRQNGFKISTLSNSKQGLDRRAQLVCSRGIVARKPRGKSQSVQTTTTRPITIEEKCLFSLTVYECRKSGRWYIRKYGNGSKIHCGHCQLLPEQVGIRSFQNLTERVGEGWCGDIGSIDGHYEISGGRCNGMNGMDGINGINGIKDKTLNNNKNKDEMRLGLGWCANNIVGQNQNQFLGNNNYSDQSLMEQLRIRQYQNMAAMNGVGWRGNNTVRQNPYLGGCDDIRDQISNYNNQLLMGQVGIRPHSNSTENFRNSWLDNNIARQNICNYNDRSLLLKQGGMNHHLPSLTEMNRAGWCGQRGVQNGISNYNNIRHLPSLAERGRAGLYATNINGADVNISNYNDALRLSNLTERARAGLSDHSYVDNNMISNSNGVRRLSNLTSNTLNVALNSRNHVDNTMISINNGNRRFSSLAESVGAALSANSIDERNKESGDRNLVDSQISKNSDVSHVRSIAERVGSSLCASNIDERKKDLDDRNHASNEISNKNDAPRAPIVAERVGSSLCASSIVERKEDLADRNRAYNHVSNGIDNDANEDANGDVNANANQLFSDEYAMLRPMAVYDYHSNSQPELVASGDQINPDDTGREETTELRSRSLKQGFYVDSSLAEETERFRHKRQKIDANR